jgi:hypothetical protein
MSLMSCVVSSSVVPCSARSVIRKCRSRSLLIMSRPIVGSSSTSSRGLCTSAAATSPRIRSPTTAGDGGVELVGDAETVDQPGDPVPGGAGVEAAPFAPM